MPQARKSDSCTSSFVHGNKKKRKAGGETPEEQNTVETPTISHGYSMQAHALRWGPGTDLVPSLLKAVAEVKASTGAASACVVTAVGSLSNVTLRMASASRMDGASNEIRTWDERLEIVSLVGTCASDGTKHLHMAVSREDGSVVGGHLMNAIVFTTLELVLGTMPGLTFTRELDAQTGYRELVVRDGSTASDSNKIPPAQELASREEQEIINVPPAPGKDNPTRHSTCPFDEDSGGEAGGAHVD